MGCSAQGSWSSRFGFPAVVMLWSFSAGAQAAPPDPPPTRADSGAASPAPQPMVKPEPPPLNPPPAPQLTAGPAFLHGREPERARVSVPEPPEEFTRRASPWLDFSLTSFYFDKRVGNFLNLGTQFGVYAFEHLRLSGRFVTPLERVEDGAVNEYDFISVPGAGARNEPVASRSISALYGASLGLVVTNSRSFVFGPNLGFLRTDVEDYGTAISLGMPFEWTTKNNLRVGFELGLGHAVGGSIRQTCISGTVSCGLTRRERPGGTAVTFQFYMGWALGRL